MQVFVDKSTTNPKRCKYCYKPWVDKHTCKKAPDVQDQRLALNCDGCKKEIKPSQTLFEINRKIYSGDDGKLIRDYHWFYHGACQPEKTPINDSNHDWLENRNKQQSGDSV